MKYLLFQLYGPLQAWGVPSPGIHRRTEDHPTKSGVMGLVASCLGIESEREEELVRLQEVVYACREDIPGTFLSDYNTIWPDSSIGSHVQRLREETPVDRFNTIVAEKEYLCGAFFTVCLSGNLNLIQKISETLPKPVFTPFLGRRNCTLGMPFDEEIVEAKNLREAFGKYTPDKRNLFPKEKFPPLARIFWEGSDKSIQVFNESVRQDRLNSRRTWTYTKRTEYEGLVERAPR